MSEHENITPPQFQNAALSSKQYSPYALAALFSLITAWIFVILFRDIGSPMLWFSALALWPISFILGIIAIFHICRNWQTRKGLAFAITVLGINALQILAVLFLYFAVVPEAARLVCRTNMEGLGKAIKVYAQEYNDKFPTACKWNDLLITYADTSSGIFWCKGSDVRHGESSFALNKNVVDINFSQLPSDIVVLFETDAGKDPNSRSGSHANEIDINFVEIENGHIVLVRSGAGLDKYRWNQVGGPEILTTAHHQGKGCNILFGDGHAKFIKTKDIPFLRWKP